MMSSDNYVPLLNTEYHNKNNHALKLKERTAYKLEYYVKKSQHEVIKTYGINVDKCISFILILKYKYNS